MDGTRVLVTGLGGELGSRVGAMLEEEPWVGSIAGFDANPPRRRLKRAAFHLIAADDRDAVARLVSDVDPHVVVHLGVWEPHARLSTDDARSATEALGESLFDACRGARSLESVVLRSGTEVYGRGGAWPRQPDEHAPPEPASVFGCMLRDLEQRAQGLADERGTVVTVLRCAPVVGPHVPSPLGRLLRLPVVPFNPFGNPRFSLVEDRDAAEAFVAAARTRPRAAINVVAPGASSVLQAALTGRRVALPVAGPGWLVARGAATVAGAPIADHVAELLVHGRCARPGDTAGLLGTEPRHSTADVIAALYRWPAVVRIVPSRTAA